MREWATQKSIPHRYVGICSDTRAGRHDEDASVMELEIPVTTDPKRISAALRERRPGFMTVVFCTYHSLPIVERAQEEGAPPFDLVLCDEAHRTTGVDRPGDRTSPFVLVHDKDRIRANKRLYMTATPRIYTESSKAKAARHEADVFSMDEEATFGPEFHRLPFSRAIERDLLSDYQVVIFTVAESRVDGTLQAHLASDRGSEINITDAAKIVGCWRALNGDGVHTGAAKPMLRSIRAGRTAHQQTARPSVPSPAPSPSPTPFGPPSDWRSTGTGWSSRPSRCSPRTGGQGRCAAGPGMWTGSTTRWSARGASTGSRVGKGASAES